MGIEKKATTAGQDQLLELLYKGRTLLEKANLQEAVEVFEEARSLFPTNKNILTHLARGYAELSRNEDAIEAYRELLKARRKTVATVVDFAKLLLEEGLAEEAQPLLEEALADSPGNLALQRNLGLAYSQLGLYEKARQLFLEANLVDMAAEMGDILNSAEEPGEDDSAQSVTDDVELSHEPETREIDLAELPDAPSGSDKSGEEVTEQKPPSTEDLVSELFADVDADRGGSNLPLPPASSRASFPFEMTKTTEIDRAQLQELLDSKASYADEEEAASSSKEDSSQVYETTVEDDPAMVEDSEGRTISVSLFPPQLASHDTLDDDDFPFVTPTQQSVPAPQSLAALLKQSHGMFPSMEAGEARLAQSGALLYRIQGHGYCRVGELTVQLGELELSVVKKRFQGRDLPADLGPAHDPLMKVEGEATVRLGAVEGESRTIVEVSKEDSLYLCSGHVAAFSPSLEWENGRFPSPLGTETDLFLDEFWGEGSLVLQVEGALQAIPVQEGTRTRVLRDALVGWFGDLVPNILFSENAGNGRVYVDFEGTGGVLLKGS